MKQAIILCGGLGTRLRSIVKDIPKPMAEVGGEPFLHWILAELDRQDFKKVFLATGYKSEFIESHFGQEFRGLKLFYSKEEKPLGTGGALKKATMHPKFNTEEMCFILNGDTFVELDFAAMEALLGRNEVDLVVALKFKKEPKRYGTVNLDENDRIQSFKEKDVNVNEGWINAGVYLLDSARILKEIKKDVFSFESEVLEEDNSNLNMHGYKTDGYFIDIGVPEDYERAQEHFGRH